MKRSPSRRVLVLAALVGLCACGSLRGQNTAGSDWWNPAWEFRRTLTLKGAPQAPRVATVELPTLRRVRTDGADVRVVANGMLLKHALLWLGPDDRMKVAFEVPLGTTSAHLYFGNPKAEPPAAWDPPAGLLLETRHCAGPVVRSLGQYRRAFKKATKIYGRDFVGRVHHGHNPFGPSKNFLSRFTGYLLCPTDGSYEFATSSDDASFLLIDGRQVCAWAGEHAAVRDARHKGRITLTAGVHRFEYCHQQRRGYCIMVAAWRIPGGKMRTIPPTAFVSVQVIEPGPLELRSGGWLPDFLALNVGEAVLTPEADRYLVRMRFANLTDAKHLKGRKVVWQFGDGLTSSEVSPEHVYLVEDNYTVTLTVLDGYREHTTSVRVEARRRPGRQSSGIDLRADYAKLVSGYDLSRCPVRHAYWAMVYFDRINRFADVISAGRELVSRKRIDDEPMLFEAVMLLGETERVHGKNYRRLERLYKNSEKRMKQPVHAAALALARGDVQQWHLKDLVRAEGCYRRVLTDYHEFARPETVRKALFRLGEIYRWRGDGAKTREFFERAQSIPCDKLTAAQRSVRSGYLARAIEDYIRNDQMTDAYDFLTKWAWEFPTDMLEGYWSALRIRWLHKNREYEGGISEAETLLKVNPQSTYAVEVLMLAADCAEALKDSKRARKLLRRALVEYPESPLRETVEKRLEQKN